MGQSVRVERAPTPVSVLLVIDAQVGVLDGPTAVPSAPEVTARIAELLAAARQARALIVHLQNDGEADTRDEPGSPGWAIHPAAEPHPGEPVLRKSGDDGFEGTDLEVLLREAGVRRLAVAGLLSELCVSSTIRAALARGFQVVLVRDAHATYDLEEIPAQIVSRVAEHALGDELELLDASTVAFVASGDPL
jgi:nicotinamidase-related amidase